MTTNMFRLPKPTHVYVARLKCGCCVGLATDCADKETGRMVAEWITDGLTVDRVAWDEYVEKVSKEPTFMDCSHRRKVEHVQLELSQAMEDDRR